MKNDKQGRPFVLSLGEFVCVSTSIKAVDLNSFWRISAHSKPGLLLVFRSEVPLHVLESVCVVSFRVQTVHKVLELCESCFFTCPFFDLQGILVFSAGVDDEHLLNFTPYFEIWEVFDLCCSVWVCCVHCELLPVCSGMAICGHMRACGFE